MCGICGFLDSGSSRDESELRSSLRAMTDSLNHRGPDSDGAYLAVADGVGLGHRRLAILDLSPEGHQPMFSSSGRYVIAYNGEIYNFESLKPELEAGGAKFRGGSDTEVLLASIEKWGVVEAIQRCVGMFVFALWDQQEKALWLGRDRLGQKPLYYGWDKGVLLFASELKALRQWPKFRPRLDQRALEEYLRYRYIPTPRSIYEGISKLAPGTLVEMRRSAEARLHTYWNPLDCAYQARRQPFEGTFDEAVDCLDQTLTEAVGIRMRSDVPLGAFLSGGIDSSLVVALMQRQSHRPVRTFTVGSYDKDFDESNEARVVAHHLQTEHLELMVSESELLASVPKMATIYDEPFADSSQLPTYLVSKLCREHVTVSLSGDGGDELFGGYNRYLWGPGLWSRLSKLPRNFRILMADALSLPSDGFAGAVVNTLNQATPESRRVRIPADKLKRLARVLPARDANDFYWRLVTDDWKTPTVSPRLANGGWNYREQMMLADTVGYLPDDILTKVDRASMAVSLELRSPFMDHRVYQLAWRFPTEWKVGTGQGKLLLRNLLARHVPDDLFDRPKTGFSVPIGSWLRGPLRTWAQELLSPSRLAESGNLDQVRIQRLWVEHQNGRRDHTHRLWTVLMLQAWLTENSL
ncbi:MAG: asparagine synthase (glutamine-hydrolyzing) [Vulcanimicrobiota bacterium]